MTTIVVIEIRLHVISWCNPFEDRFCVSRRVGQGEVGGCTTLGDTAWRLLQLAIERAWSVLDGLFFCFLVQTGIENGPFTCRNSISDFLGSFQSGGAFSGQRALTIKCSVMSGCGQGHESAKNF